MAGKASTGAQASPSQYVRESGGGGMLVADARIAFMLINETRCRAIQGVFGCSREQANVATFAAALLLGHEMHARWRQVMEDPAVPEVPEHMIGTAVLRELLSDVAGPGVRDSPQLSSLLLAA